MYVSVMQQITLPVLHVYLMLGGTHSTELTGLSFLFHFSFVFVATRREVFAWSRLPCPLASVDSTSSLV